MRIVREKEHRFWASHGDPPERWSWRRELGPLSFGVRRGEQVVVHFDHPAVGVGLVVDFRMGGARAWVEAALELRPAFAGAPPEVLQLKADATATATIKR